MTLSEFKTNFENELKGTYPDTETHSFFKIIIDHYLQLSRIDAALNPHQEIPNDKVEALHSCITELKAQKPIQYIIGHTEFYGLQFKVNPSVLIPRPETEELVAWILESATKDDVILDIGTGSGCIPITIAKNLNSNSVGAIDISTKALETAKQNAELNAVSIDFMENNILETTSLEKQYSIIVSNPPYVRNLEKEEMNKNVLAFEPHLALFVEDHDALLFYRTIAKLATKSLVPNGLLFFEINQAYGTETIQLLEDLGFTNIELRQDIFGVDRMVKATFK